MAFSSLMVRYLSIAMMAFIGHDDFNKALMAFGGLV
jgi:hypothetical protein